MQRGLLAGLRRLVPSGRLRLTPSAVFLSTMCASTISPVIATAAGLADPTGMSVNVLSALGSGVLGGLGLNLLDQLRKGREQPQVNKAELSEEISELLRQHLTQGTGEQTEILSAEIFGLFKRIDAGEIIWEAAGEAETESAVLDLLAAVDGLSVSFSGGNQLLQDVALAIAQVGQDVADQGADIRELVIRVSANSASRSSSYPRTTAGSCACSRASGRDRAVPSVIRGKPLPPGECPYLGLAPFKEEDAHVFHGRGELVKELADKVASGARTEASSWSPVHPGPESRRSCTRVCCRSWRPAAGCLDRSAGSARSSRRVPTAWQSRCPAGWAGWRHRPDILDDLRNEPHEPIRPSSRRCGAMARAWC